MPLAVPRANVCAMSGNHRVRTLVDTLLARPASDTRRPEYTHLLLILLWHFIVFLSTVVFVDWWLGYGATDNGGPIPQPFDWNRVREEWLHPFLAAVLLPVVVVEGLVGWLIFGLVTRRHGLSSRVFIRTWWRACGWGTVIIPSLSFMIAYTSMSYDIGMNGILLGPVFLILGPAWLVRDELKPHRSVRWQPECPECGYSLRGLTELRCPECGAGFPIDIRTSRRWAVRRLPWDRTHRGARLFAYLKSLARVAFMPASAARSVAVPDRWMRCGLWASGHLMLAVIAAVLLANGHEYVRWVADRIWPSAFRPPHLFDFTDPPLDRVAIWSIQSFILWALAFAVPAVIGCLLSLGIPGRHRAAKLGGLKWSLYLVPLFLLALASWYGFYVVFPPKAQATFPMTLAYKLPPPEVPMWLLVGPYGIWWAIGMAANQYSRTHKRTATTVYAAVFFGTWLLVTHVLFAPGPLESVR